MTTSRSSKVEAVIRSISAVPGVEIAPKFRTKQSMLCIGKYGSVELRLIELITTTGTQVVVTLEKLKANACFLVSVGGPWQSYGHIEEHKILADSFELSFYTLPEGAYAKEFIEAFSCDRAKRGLQELRQIGWHFTLSNQQIEIMVPAAATEPEITACVEKVLKLATQAPYGE